MSLSAVNLQHKITSAKDLKGVVRTMKSVAASNINQYEASASALIDYFRAIELGLALSLQTATKSASLSAKLYPNKHTQSSLIHAIVFGSDQGLVGQFNEDVANFALTKLKEFGPPVKVYVVGEQIYSRLSDAGMNMGKPWMLPTNVNTISILISQIQLKMVTQEKGAVGPSSFSNQSVHVFYNRMVSNNFFEPVVDRLLPLDQRWQKQFKDIPWPTNKPAEILGSNTLTLRALISEYVFISLYRACAHSLASENASRLAAMQRAEKNIEELLEKLSSDFNGLRQSVIDEE